MFPFISKLKPSTSNSENELHYSTESNAALTELIAKYHAIQALKIADVNAFGKQSETVGDGNPQIPALTLKRFLLILSDRIFDSSVDRAIPSFAAAPDGPDTRPWHSRRVASIISLS